MIFHLSVINKHKYFYKENNNLNEVKNVLLKESSLLCLHSAVKIFDFNGINENILIPIEATKTGIIFACIHVECHPIKEEYTYVKKNIEFIEYDKLSDFDQYKCVQN